MIPGVSWSKLGRWGWRRGAAFLIGLVLFVLPTMASGTSHAFTITAPAANTVWTAGSALPILWTGPGWVTSVNISLIDVPSWTVAMSIAAGVPNNGSYAWTLPNNLPASTYQIYIEDVNRKTWGYGGSFVVVAEQKEGFDLTVGKKPLEPLVAGQPGAYGIYVTNLGPGPAPGPITVTDYLDPNMTFVSATGSGWTCSSSGSVVTCVHPGPVPAMTSLPPIILTVNLSERAKEVKNCVAVDAKGDLNPENDRDCVGSELEYPTGLICGVKFNDENGNGIQDSGEMGIGNFVMELMDANGVVFATVTTDSDGVFCFKDVRPGTYTVAEQQQAGWTQTYPTAPPTYTVTTEGPDYTVKDLLFGNTRLTGSVCGVKFNDKNGNGKWDTGEAGLPGWTFDLYDANGVLVASGTTGDDGTFCFDGLPLGTYTLVEQSQPGWVQTYPAAPGSYSITLTGEKPHLDGFLFGNRPAQGFGSFCGLKFHDKNGNGIQDPGEPGLTGWTIELRDASGTLIATAVTDANGRYCFIRIKLGTYIVAEVMQPGWEQTYPGTPGTHLVNVTAAQNPLVLFGNRETPCCLSFRIPAGQVDDFSQADGPELTWRSPALASAMSAWPVADFDENRQDRHFGQTLSLPFGNCLTSARLTIRVKPLGTLAYNDTLSLQFTGVAGAPSWSTYFGSGSPPSLLPSTWNPGNYPSGQILVLDLGSLPGGVDLIPALHANRFLDVRIQDDTAIDYMVLTVEFCECAKMEDPVASPDHPER